MNRLKQRLGQRLSRYLSEPGHTAGTAAPTRMDLLAHVLRPADVLLVEGTSRVSSAIKYLTQSTWSHAALYVGQSVTGESQFLEADMVHGVRLVTLAHFTGFHCRVCRPVSLSEAERQTIGSCGFAVRHEKHRRFSPLPVAQPARTYALAKANAITRQWRPHTGDMLHIGG